MKRPSFQFYPGDWLSDIGVSMLSEAAEGLYIRLLCHAHQSVKRGYLMIGNDKMTTKDVQKLSKSGPKRFKILFNEILNFGLFLTDENGYFYNKRMVKDSQLEQKRRDCGKQGGNPNLVNQNSTTQVNQNPTPSSSSSSSCLGLGKKNTHTEKLRVCSDQKIDQELQNAVRQGVDYLKASNNVNLVNTAWVEGFLIRNISERRKHRPDMSLSEILACWQKTCDNASAKGKCAPKWFETVFTGYCVEYKKETAQSKGFVSVPTKPPHWKQLKESRWAVNKYTGEHYDLNEFDKHPTQTNYFKRRSDGFALSVAELETCDPKT